MTTREQLIQALQELGLLEPVKFKAAAYKRAANTLFNMNDEDFNSMESYTSLPGIGTSINNKIVEFKTTGRIEKLIKLRNENIDKLDEKLYKVRKSFITKRIPLVQADAIYNEEIAKYIGNQFNIEIAGSYRRRAEYIADIDILVLNGKQRSQDALKQIVKLLDTNPHLTKLVEGDMKVSYKIDNSENTQIDITACKEGSDAFAIMHFTGPKEFNIMCRNQAIKRGYRLSQNGLTPMNGSPLLPWTLNTTEKQIMLWLGLDMKYLDPRNRR